MRYQGLTGRLRKAVGDYVGHKTGRMKPKTLFKRQKGAERSTARAGERSSMQRYKKLTNK